MTEKISLQPLEKKALYIKISDAIYSYIMLNHLQPGDKLPSEREMASVLGTSRNSLREGLHILENRGLLEIRTGSGTYIKNPYDPDGVLELQLHGFQLCRLQELQLHMQPSLLRKQQILNRALKLQAFSISR